MSTSRVDLKFAIKFLFVNILFLIASVIIVSGVMGTSVTASADDDSSAVVAQAPVVQRPATVTGFKAVKTAVHAVKLGWNATNNAEGYIIFKAGETDTTWVEVAQTKNHNTTYTVSGLTAGAKYRFAVKAYVTDDNGNRLTSPSFPTITTTTYLERIGGFKVASTSTNAVKLSWNKAAGANGNIVYQYNGNQKKWQKIANTANVNTYTVKKLSSNKAYVFAVKAYKKVSNKNAVSISYPTVSAKTKKPTVSKPYFVAESKYESSATHPYNKQTNTLVVNWYKVNNAKYYQLFIKGGKFKNWTYYRSVSANYCTVSGLARATNYYFKVRAVNGSELGELSDAQSLKTARINYDAAGWEAMCRIVYHEVGQINNDMWDRPIVYVADCVVNRYVAAKYAGSNNWSAAYSRYSNIQNVIYNSGGFMSSSGLAGDGAVYSRVPTKVKLAVYGATYGLSAYKGIANDYNIYFWCNRSNYQSDSRIAYSFRIPWGYFNIWRTYWG
ncbi:MAG: fibronectin type III domain-containing protein [Ruminococcus sp.]|nr:fibronectin type III domain-containing protein [Ruminococcus sp.]